MEAVCPNQTPTSFLVGLRPTPRRPSPPHWHLPLKQCPRRGQGPVCETHCVYETETAYYDAVRESSLHRGAAANDPLLRKCLIQRPRQHKCCWEDNLHERHRVENVASIVKAPSNPTKPQQDVTAG